MSLNLNLIFIIISILLIGVLTLGLSAIAAFKLNSKSLERMVSLSIGLMLATSLIHAIPEALEMVNHTGHSEHAHHGLQEPTVLINDTETLFYILLSSILGFFLLQKLALIRHNHHHEHDGHNHNHGHDAHIAGSGAWMILLGSSLHNFIDGLVIAAAFMTDMRLGLLTALSIAAHEIPHKLSDYVIIVNAGFSRRRALIMDALSSLTLLIGGVLGWSLLGVFEGYIPILLMISAASFIYIAMSDLIPYVQHQSRVGDVLPQISLIVSGVFLVWGLHHIEFFLNK